MEHQHLTLYVARGSERAEAAVRAFEEVCRRAGSRVEGEVVDVVRQPERAAADGVLATPTLVRWGGDGLHTAGGRAAPMRVVGDVTDARRLWRELGLGGDGEAE